MEKGWARIWSANDDFRVAIARQLLDDNDIESIVINKRDSFYQWGEIEIYVQQDDILRAKQLLKGFEP